MKTHMTTYDNAVSTLFCAIFISSPCFSSENFDITIPDTFGNSNILYSSGIVTNAVKDGNLKLANLADLKPRLMRWPEGTTGTKILFNKNNPSVFNVGIRDPSAWWVDYMGISRTDWTFSCAFPFDSFVQVCKRQNATPIVIIGITPAYTSSSSPHATQPEVIQAAKDFVYYANVQRKYGISYWEIGNEDDYEGASAAQYASVFNAIVPELKNVDPSIKCGANNMTGIDRWNQLIPLFTSKPDFLVTHTYSWVTSYESWYPNEDAWNWEPTVKEATDAIDAHPDAPRALFVTEISCFTPGNENDGNTTWKGLHNIQRQLQALSRPYTRGMTTWVSRWNENAWASSYNLFDPSYNLTPTGWSCVFSSHILKNLNARRVSNLITVYVSHSDKCDSMSIFVLNRDSTSSQAKISIHGFKGVLKYDKWLYAGSSANSTDAHFSKELAGVNADSSITLTLNPLSATILDYYYPHSTNILRTFTNLHTQYEAQNSMSALKKSVNIKGQIVPKNRQKRGRLSKRILFGAEKR